ncbi:aminopeptidase P family protein [Sediminispirochaeta smaragdinae]|uniref:Peptidase M24 n=1 Tax=Sediminispirochaeta smaragdinae (strain DSM 11293 / JCM 15392 / SEBR 4228) TaxID=573413 RepID=E1RA77_SEDSS|nr:aminopeptidase P family protein [Sediminispirochaeta smaragdinae]ADK79368.1 peptidase M24 [Sediminispirochaeta smaragdinae DSM 11293]
MNNPVLPRLSALRREMEERALQAVVFFGTDPHQSEYAAPRWKDRLWMSGFSGSAGTVVVTETEAALWTDSRYWLQATDQLDGSGIVLMADGDPSVPSLPDWLISKLSPGARVGVDYQTLSVASERRLSHILGTKGIALVSFESLLNDLWTDRPARPCEPLYAIDLHYVGKSRDQKITLLRDAAKNVGADAMFLSALDEIAWLLNLRGNDIAYNPFFFSYLLIRETDTLLFADIHAVSKELEELLAEEHITLKAYEAVGEMLREFEGTLFVDPASFSMALKGALSPGVRIVEEQSPVAALKARKEAVEVEGFRHALRKDGVALVRFWMRLERMLERGDGDEISVASLLYEERSRMPGFVGESFAPIVGFAEHGAVVHYSATKESAIPVTGRGLLLIDSGGQYIEGTTDITRVFAVGKATEEEIFDYTTVLKAHISLATAIFPIGTVGTRLDAMARRPMWEAGLNYGHGTGHGVGAFLGVHEGPQSISTKLLPVPIEPGMVCSNEPGVYREGKHGIRIENLILAVEKFNTPFGRFLGFETLTPFPFECKLIDVSLLTEGERQWVDRYHAWVFELLSSELNPQERSFLAAKTGVV